MSSKKKQRRSLRASNLKARRDRQVVAHLQVEKDADAVRRVVTREYDPMERMYLSVNYEQLENRLGAVLNDLKKKGVSG